MSVTKEQKVVITREEVRRQVVTVGARGPAGAGIDGASAYEVAVAGGFIGTEAQWLATLVGAPGSDATVTSVNITAALGAAPIIEGDARLTNARTPTAHAHVTADVTGLQTALDGKQPTLTAGANVIISGTTISSTAGGLDVERYTFAPVAPQTVFSVPYAPASALMVYVNGAMLDATAYTLGANTVTLADAAVAGDTVEVFVLAAPGELAVPRIVWKDMLAAVGSATVPNQNAPASNDFGPAHVPQRRERSFGIGDYVFIQPFHTNHDILPGGEAYLHVHWATNGTNTGLVQWELTVMRAKGHNQANFAAPTVTFIEAAAAGTAWRHMVSEAAVPLIMTEPDELIIVTLRRVTPSAGSNADLVFALQVDLHYQADREGTPFRSPDFYATGLN